MSVTKLRPQNDLFKELDGSRDGAASFFVQWKGTSVCGDFHCTCGLHSHICGEEFVYSILCGRCGKRFAVQHTLYLLECAHVDEREGCYVIAEDSDAADD